MPPPIISDTFEAFEHLAGQAAKSAKQVPKKIVKQIPKSLETGFLGQKAGEAQPAQGGKDQTQAAEQQKIQKMEAFSKQKAAQRYREIQQQILAISKKRHQELPKQVTGKPGFSEEKLVKQLEIQKKPEKEKEKQEPISLKREKTKTERFRGAAG